MSRLYKNKKNGKVFGVCAGLADYFECDVTIIRLIWAFAIIFAGAGVLAYIIAALIMPNKKGID